MEFNIEEWQRLAQEDPGEFERRRQAVIASVIEQAPAELRDRLRGLQFRIDMERRRAKTPLGATVRLQSMMWESFVELRDTLQALATGEGPVASEPVKARVLPFTKPE